MGREVVTVAFCGGGPLDGETKRIDIWAQDYLYPSIYAPVPPGDDQREWAHRYERRVFQDPVTGSNYTKMVYVGEEEQ